MTMKNNFITMKEYEECYLLLPLPGTSKFVVKIVCIFNNNIENLLIDNKHGVKSRMLTKIDCYIKYVQTFVKIVDFYLLIKFWM